MKKREWNEALDHIDPDLVEEYIVEKDRLRVKRRKERVFLRAVALAACLALVVGVVVAVPMLQEDDPTIIPRPDESDSTPIFPDGEMSETKDPFGMEAPTGKPTEEPTEEPTESPTEDIVPSDSENDEPTEGIVPTGSPIESPTESPTDEIVTNPPILDEATEENGTGAVVGEDRIENVKIPFPAPQYYGSKSSSVMSSGVNEDANPAGISVTAQLIEMLPDTYTFIDDWMQYEYRLLRMKTVKLLRGTEMTEEFYYMVPIAFMTDFSVFNSFVIKDMAQFAYEYSVMYNKTQGKAEQLNLALFGYRVYGYNLMGGNFTAYNVDGNFDERLWNANEAWIEGTKNEPIIGTIAQAETIIQQEDDGWTYNFYVHLLKDISGEAANVLKTIKSFENGIFVPAFSSSKLFLSPEVQFHAVRYINGFATNEKVSIWCKEWTRGDQYTYAYTKARFNEEDMNCLPDLPSAFESIIRNLNSGSVTPPHFNNQEKLRKTTSGVFGWYAKTENGVVGIVRVTWCFYTEKYENYYDDAYYIIEYGSDECKAIDRDALLELLGDYETTYIYTGEYNEYGKYSDIVYPVA